VSVVSVVLGRAMVPLVAPARVLHCLRCGAVDVCTVVASELLTDDPSSVCLHLCVCVCVCVVVAAAVSMSRTPRLGRRRSCVVSARSLSGSMLLRSLGSRVWRHHPHRPPHPPCPRHD
jgi:hypothetical protein